MIHFYDDAHIIHVFDTAVLSSKGSVDISHDHTAEFVKETPDPVRVEETDDKVCVVYRIAEDFIFHMYS